MTDENECAIEQPSIAAEIIEQQLREWFFNDSPTAIKARKTYPSEEQVANYLEPIYSTRSTLPSMRAEMEQEMLSARCRGFDPRGDTKRAR